MKRLFTVILSGFMATAGAARAAAIASDDASDAAYESGWTNGANGGTGFGAWILNVGGRGGHFTGSSALNAGGASGDIDTAGRSWGIWSTNGVTEAVRSLTGGGLTTGQVLSLSFDNGYVGDGRSVGFGIQNNAGDDLCEFYFSGGDLYDRVHQAYGIGISPVPYTGDGLAIEFELTGASSYLVRVHTAFGADYYLTGDLIAQSDSSIARLRFWNYDAGAGSDHDLFVNSLSVSWGAITVPGAASAYPIVDTGQTTCYNTSSAISAPLPGAAFAGQDAQYTGAPISYSLSADGLTVHDHNTGLTWTRSPDLNGDGLINYADKLSVAAAATNAATLNARNFGGYNDWRLPTIKELYSLMDFRGGDPSSYMGSDPSGLRPFIDTNYFRVGYGDTGAGERIIDAQWATLSIYSSTTMTGNETMFGLNLADGRIKGYPADGAMKLYYVYYVRGNTNYGINQFVDLGDGTVLDLATGLQWQQGDSGTGMNWQAALTYAENLQLGGCRDWRLPNAKELESILDYSRGPDATASPAIDPVFVCTAITNEAGALDYPCYWSSTTHTTWTGDGSSASYLSFGRAMGYFENAWRDVHGAGAQRSDPKDGNPADYPFGHGPQGDAVRIYNYVRGVRGGAAAPSLDTDADGLTDWYEWNYAGSYTGMEADGDEDHDGFLNLAEAGADTSPIDDASYLGIQEPVRSANALVIQWASEAGKTYSLERCGCLMCNDFSGVMSGIAAEPPMNTYTDFTANAMDTAFYRVLVE